VVEVEERALRSLKEHALAGAEGLVDEERGVGDVRTQAGGERLHAIGQVAGLERLFEQAVLLCQGGHELLPEDLGIEDVLHADAQPRGLVRVRGPDPPPGRPDLEPAEAALACRVRGDVPRHDQMGVAGDSQPVGLNSSRLELVELLDEQAGVDDAAGSDNADRAAVEDSRGDVVELERLAVADDGVSGVGAALVAAHDVGALGEQVDDLALPLVSPLRPHDHGRGHAEEIRRGPGRRRR
jgi:hypothetical protein